MGGSESEDGGDWIVLRTELEVGSGGRGLNWDPFSEEAPDCCPGKIPLHLFKILREDPDFESRLLPSRYMVCLKHIKSIVLFG
jgi:hypothetical protein